MSFHRGSEFIGIVPNAAEASDRLKDGLGLAACVVSDLEHKPGLCRGVCGNLADDKGGFYVGEHFLVLWGEPDKTMASRLANRPRRCIVYVGDKPPGTSSQKLMKMYKAEGRNVLSYVASKDAFRVVCAGGSEPVVQIFKGNKWVEDKPAKKAKSKPAEAKPAEAKPVEAKKK
jgi:hypothetical protein